MREVAVEDAVGLVLCHDITRIVPGEFKGPAFKKGHVVTQNDIHELLRVGKEHLYVLDPMPGYLHEDEAARRIATAVAGENLTLTSACEGRVNLSADVQGLLVVDPDILFQINALGEIALASLHTFQEVLAGQLVAGTRVIPLLIDEEKIRQVEQCCTGRKTIRVAPFRACRVGVVTTGSEVYHGRIKDAFGPVLQEKFTRLGSTVIAQRITSDDEAMTAAAIRDLIDDGADLIAVTGGMSVDPDDRTPAAIRAAGGKQVVYGAPTFPGAMFLLAHIGDVPVVGLPGCVMYHRASIFDLIVPRILAGVDVTASDVAALGHGGFCAACAECRYPACAFGKG
ncbi:molybdopterin-binding protein [Desulfolutivibrio sp.]|uniref:molybdopterin-binding protein n=1 Tax=Desulfolutivibrio sp. TaxID=2773296 RepID=UPI002F96B200